MQSSPIVTAEIRLNFGTIQTLGFEVTIIIKRFDSSLEIINIGILIHKAAFPYQNFILLKNNFKRSENNAP